jgi:ER lumen protein retaining receptor
MSDICWTLSMYLEAVAMLPQIYMFQRQAADEGGIVEVRNRISGYKTLTCKLRRNVIMKGKTAFLSFQHTTFCFLTFN